MVLFISSVSGAPLQHGDEMAENYYQMLGAITGKANHKISQVVLHMISWWCVHAYQDS